MAAPEVLVVRHVPWEGPHRIGEALLQAGLTVDLRRPLDGDALPAVGDVAGAVFMGGPMNVDETDRHPALAVEREWLAAAIAADLPVLGVCLGSQLIARAAGCDVVPGPRAEIGWSPVTVFDPDDPVTGALAPATEVLHWHGDIFKLPPEARPLARSELTEIQAFRVRNAWGLLFHAEADEPLVETWLAERSMHDEAIESIGSDAAERLTDDARRFGPRLVERSQPGFAAFARLVAARTGLAGDLGKRG